MLGMLLVEASTVKAGSSWSMAKTFLLAASSFLLNVKNSVNKK
jgi:hypothetical protein